MLKIRKKIKVLQSTKEDYKKNKTENEEVPVHEIVSEITDISVNDNDSIIINVYKNMDDIKEKVIMLKILELRKHQELQILFLLKLLIQ